MPGSSIEDRNADAFVQQDLEVLCECRPALFYTVELEKEKIDMSEEEKMRLRKGGTYEVSVAAIKQLVQADSSRRRVDICSNQFARSRARRAKLLRAARIMTDWMVCISGTMSF